MDKREKLRGKLSERLKNKKAQFFVIFAVLLGVLIIGAASLANQAKSSDGVESFQAKCQNYKNEIFRISQYASKQDPSQELSFIKDFSEGFTDYMNDTYEFSMYFLYGTSVKSFQVNFPEGKETVQAGKLFIEIEHDKFIRTYSLKEDNSFHFLMIAKKNGETYICE